MHGHLTMKRKRKKKKEKKKTFTKMKTLKWCKKVTQLYFSLLKHILNLFRL